MQAIMEILFDVVYLSLVITLGIIMIKNSKSNRQYLIFGIMAVTLGFGDSFHLVPRGLALATTGLENFAFSLGIGKLITSITMTFFYIMLYYVWRERYDIKGKTGLTATIFSLSFIRIALLLFPQNAWTSLDAPLSWGIYRNIPFALIGIIIIVLFYNSSKKHDDRAFKNMWLTIVLSFAFYIPVVLFSSQYPLVGILMIPKTCAYVWTVLIGFNDMKAKKLS